MSLTLQGQILKFTLPLHEKFVYLYLGYLAEDDGTRIFPSIQTICEVAGLQRRQVFYILRSLEDQGLIDRQGGRGRSPTFTIPVQKNAKGKFDIVPHKESQAEEQSAESEEQSQNQGRRHLSVVPSQTQPLDINALERNITTYQSRLAGLVQTLDKMKCQGADSGVLAFQEELVDHAQQRLDELRQQKARFG